MPKSPQPFFWYELMTTDLDAAEAFYTAVVGWKAEPFDKAPGMPRYIVVNSAVRGVGGLMTLPEDAAKMGMPPAWIGYIYTKGRRRLDASAQGRRWCGASGARRHSGRRPLRRRRRPARRDLHVLAAQSA